MVSSVSYLRDHSIRFREQGQACLWPYLKVAPWLIIAPGVAIGITVFSVNMLGDALRDVLDPRLRGTGSSA